jgi:hypothetical protein
MNFKRPCERTVAARKIFYALHNVHLDIQQGANTEPSRKTILRTLPPPKDDIVLDKEHTT